MTSKRQGKKRDIEGKKEEVGENKEKGRDRERRLKHFKMVFVSTLPRTPSG